MRIKGDRILGEIAYDGYWSWTVAIDAHLQLKILMLSLSLQYISVSGAPNLKYEGAVGQPR